jgi:hypothetical protein
MNEDHAQHWRAIHRARFEQHAQLDDEAFVAGCSAPLDRFHGISSTRDRRFCHPYLTADAHGARH